MGYTIAEHFTRNDAQAARFALERIQFDDGTDRTKVLAFSTDTNVVGCGYDFVTYAAVEIIENGNRMVIALTVLQHRTASQVGYKFVDETMGPNNSRCPIALLDRLTPTENTYALRFRRISRLFQEGLPNAPKIHKMTMGAVA